VNLFRDFLLLFYLNKVNRWTSTAWRNFLAKKKKPGKYSPSLLLSDEEQRLLDRLLEELEALAPAKLVDQIPSPALAEKLVENLPFHRRETPEIMAGIGSAFPQKAVQKALKKRRFKLKQEGVSLPDLKPEADPSFAITKEIPVAYVGPIDGLGNRPVLITIPQSSSGVDLAMGVVNDTKGIIDFVYDRISRKKMKEIKEMFFSKVPHMVETSLAHATTVLEHAYLQEKENPGDPAGAYLRLRPWLLQNTKRLDRPAVSESIPLGAVSPGMVTETQIQRLLHHELMASWAMDPETLGALVEDITRAEESPIFISEAQRREHISRIKEEGLAKIFGDKERRILKDRLQEMAYVFFKMGEETIARLCVAASLSLDAKDALLKANTLLNALVDRSLAQLPKPTRSSPLILR
jgi:hypothetical protein